MINATNDAKEVIRWVRANASSGVNLGINPSHVIASGGSAGGQLAAATYIAADTTAERTNALILFNPVMDVCAYMGAAKCSRTGTNTYTGSEANSKTGSGLTFDIFNVNCKACPLSRNTIRCANHRMCRR